MIGYLAELFGVSLGLTIALELPVGVLFGMGSRKNLFLMILVNILTNPAAVLLHSLGCPQIPIEIAVVAAEAFVYWRFAKTQDWHIPHPVWLALSANAISWGVGLLIQL